MFRPLRFAFMAVVVVATASGAFAQEQRGSVEGLIKDASGGVLPGVIVEARSPSLVGSATAVSNADGLYRFPALAPGAYTITGTLQGFTAARAEHVVLALGQVLRVNLTLSVAGISESVKVTAELPMIDVKQNAAGATVARETIDLIPKGRNFTSVIAEVPGANDENRSGGISIDGASGSENRFVIDGLDTTALRSGVSNKPMYTDFLEQVQVKTSGYNAEYRATTGGVVSAVSRKGGDTFHGDVGAYYANQSSLFRGDVRPTLRLNPSNNLIAESVIIPADRFSDTQPLFDVGGPLMKDRIWFFAGYIPDINLSQRTVTFRDTGTTQTFKKTDRDHQVNYNVTGKLAEKLNARFTGGNQRVVGTLGFPNIDPDGTSTSVTSQFNDPNRNTSDTFNDGYSVVVDWVASPTLYVNMTGGSLRYGSHDVAGGIVNTGIRRTFSTSNVNFSDVPSSLQHVSGYADSISNNFNQGDNYGRFAVSTDATYYGKAKGQHTLKTGIQFERLSNEVDLGARASNIAISWNASRTTNDVVPRVVRGPYGFYTVARTFTQGSIHSNNVGLFVQDAWQINPRVTLNLGVRTDREDIPSYVADNPGIHFSFKDKIAPRAGFAWDVRGDGRTKAYGSWGMFYDISKLEMPRGSFGADHSISYYYTLDTFNYPSISCEGPPGTACPGTFIEQVDFRHPSNDRNNPLIDPNLMPIRTQEAIVGMDREITGTMSVGARYVHKWLDRTIEDVGLIVPGVGEVFKMANPGFGIAEFTLGPSFPAQPPAKRVYDALELRVIKRLSHHWQGMVSFTESRLFGNYSGLSSSDEPSATGAGRNSPSVDRFFDGLYMSFDESAQPVYGRLGTDRPHLLKAQFSYVFPWGTSVGADQNIESGSPMSSQVTIKGVPVFYHGRGDLGRTPTLTVTNLLVQHTLSVFGQKKLNLQFNVNNLFDQDAILNMNITPYRDTLPVSDVQFFAGFNGDAIKAATPSIRVDPRYRQGSTFQGRRTATVLAKLTF